MQRNRNGRGGDLASFLEFCDLPSDSQVDLSFPDDVLAHALGDLVQNNDRIEDRNLMQNPNPFFSNLNPNQNQEQERDLFSPFANVHLNPNLSNLTEPWHQSYYQSNPELFMPSNLLSNQNQDMAIPLCQTNANVVAGNSNIASTSRRETNNSRGNEYQSIQTQSTGLSNLTEPWHQPYYQPNSELCMLSNLMSNQNQDMARPPCHTNANVVAENSNIASTSRGETNISRPSRKRGNEYQSIQTQSTGLSNLTEPWHQPYYQPNPELCMPSNLLSNQNQDNMARPPRQTNANVVPSNSNTASTSRGKTNISRPSNKRGNAYQSIQTQTTGLIRNRASYSGTGNSAFQSAQQNTEGFDRSTRMRLDPGHARTGLGTDSPGTAQHMGLPRPNQNPDQLMPFQAVASNTLPTPLTGGAFVPTVGTNTSHMPIISETTTAPAPVRATRVTSQSQYTVNEALPVALPLSHHQRAQNAAVPVPVRRTVSHQQPIRSIASSGASDIRSQGTFVDQAVPTIPSAPASSAVYQFVRNTASTSQTGNSGAPVVQARPRSQPFIRTRTPGGTANASPSQVQHADNMIRNREQRVYYRDGREIEVLLITEEVLDEWRQIDRHHDMRLDIDNMSFEELVALEERIGTVNTGVSEQTVNTRMRRRPFSALLGKDSEPCCICQEEYVETDEVGTLDCGHDFHPECIKKWLAQKNICPICKKPGIKP